MNVPALFESSLRRRDRDEALECGGQILTFGDLDRRSNRLARLFGARGVRPRDRVAVYLENRVEFIDVVLACLKLGAILVPINILYQAREIGHILADAEPKTLVSAGPVPGGHAFWDVNDLLAAGADQPAGPLDTPAAGDSPAAIVYTSGTTGSAKGAVLRHGNIVANATSLLEAWRITRDDRLLLPLPLFHVHGLGNGVCCWLASGCRLRLLPRFDHRSAAAEFLSFRPTLFFGVPTIYVRLLSLAPEIAAGIGAGMRLFVSGSAPLPVHVFDAFEQRFGHRILERYGMTETLMNCSNPLVGERRAGTVGPPLPGVSVKLVDAAGVEVQAGEAGQVLLRGANVFEGYWRQPDATRAAFDAGWFRTGDIGVRSADGYVTLRGRMTDLIISGGFNIYPREVEEVLLADPAVLEAVVVGVPDEIRGEVPVAYVVTGEAVQTEALRTRLSGELASFKIPRAFVRVDSLPRTALGKIQKHLLPPWTP